MAHFELRWAQLDVTKQMEPVEFIKDFILLLADSVYNGLPLYLEDRIKTPSYQLPADTRFTLQTKSGISLNLPPSRA